MSDDGRRPDRPRGKVIPPWGALVLAGGLLLLTSFLSLAGGAMLVVEVGTLEDRDGAGELKGWVKNTDGYNVVDAVVTVGDVSGATNGTGRYHLHGVPVGLQTVRFEKPGYVTYAQEKILVDGVLLRLDASLTRDRVVERHDPGTVNATVTPLMVDDPTSGAPEPAAMVLTVRGLGFRESLEASPGTPLELADVPRGLYSLNLSCTLPGNGTTACWNRSEVFIATEGQAVSIAVGPRQRSGPPDPVDVHWVNGTVTVPAGIDHTTVVVGVHRWDGAVNETTPDADGAFTLGEVPRGVYVLTVWSPGVKLFEIRDLEVDPGPNGTVPALTIALERAAPAEESLFEGRVYAACGVLYIITAVIVMVSGFATMRGRYFTFAVFGAVMGMFLGFLGSLNTPVCFASIFALGALVIILRSRTVFVRGELP